MTFLFALGSVLFSRQNLSSQSYWGIPDYYTSSLPPLECVLGVTSASMSFLNWWISGSLLLWTVLGIVYERNIARFAAL